MVEVFLISIVMIVIFSLFGSYLNKKYFSLKNLSPTCLGFLVFFGIFEIFFFLGYLFKLPNIYNHLIVILIFVIMLIISLKQIKNIKWSNKNILLGICILLVIAVISIIYFYNDHFLKTADVNFYVDIIKDGIEISKVRPDFGATYTVQSYYQFFSSVIYIIKKFFNFGIFSIMNIWALFNTLSFFLFIELWIISLFHLIRYRVKRPSQFITYLLSTFLFIFTPWILVTTSHGNTYRILAIFALILVMLEYFKKRSKELVILLLLLFISLISFTSSGLFMGGALLYAFLIYGLYDGKNKIIADTVILSLPLSIYAISFYKILIYIFPIIYIVFLVLNHLKITTKVENCLFHRKVIFMCLPVLFIAISFTVKEISMVSFFTQPYQDVVQDLFNFKFNRDFIKPIYNICYFCIIGLIIFKSNDENENSFIRYLIITSLITFLNPLVFPFVYKYLTNEVYFRLNELIYNPLIIIYLLNCIYKNKRQLSIIMVNCLIFVMNLLNLQIYRNNFILDFNKNPFYHFDESMITTINRFDNYIYQNNIEPEKTTIISQIPSLTLLSDNKYNEVMNFMFYRHIEDYPNYKENSFHNLFAPFDELNEKEQYNYNYTYACTYAIYKEANFIIVDNENYGELAKGLWPCVEIVESNDEYIIFKVRPDLWRENINQEFTGDYSDEILMYTSEKIK